MASSHTLETPSSEDSSTTGEDASWWCTLRNTATDFSQTALKRYRIHVRSGFLALWALESIAPLAVLTAAIFGWLGYRTELVDWVGQTMASSILGSTSTQAADWLTAILDKTTFGQLGLLGTVSSVFVVYQLYVATLFDVNEILGPDEEDSGSERSWLTHFALFLPFAIWVGLLMVGGMVATGWMLQQGHYWGIPCVYAGSVVVLGGGPWMLCRQPPEWAHLLRGAAVGALWLELLKIVFFVYSTSSFGSSTLDTTYRQLAFLPLVFLWMHLLWFSVLVGMIVAHISARGAAPDPSASPSTSDA